jgi:hypothetical protein
VALEGVHWQLVPWQLLALACAAVALLRRQRLARSRRIVRVAGRAALALGILAGGVGLLFARVPQLPRPSGPHLVGSVVFHWTDAQRPETLATGAGERRQVVAQAWYPTETAGPPVPYFEAQGRLPAYVDPYPAWFYADFDKVDTHASASPPVSAERPTWPVLMFLPGWGSPREDYSSLCADLASRGYVVVALSHPYESAVSVLADGRVVGAVAASAPGWLLALGGLIGTASIVPQLGWNRALPVALLCASPPSAMWITRRAIKSRRIRTTVPATLLARRYHGSLDAIADSERRALRPIGTTAHEIAARTGVLLADLVTFPDVRIFQGVRPAGADVPRIAHAVSAGRMVVLVESVAWPPGRYLTTTTGRIHCDGVYIGQSVRPLIAAVRHWREVLPRTHRVSAVVVVHPTADGDVALPPATARDLAWVHADSAVDDIRQRLPRGRQAGSRTVVAALLAATTGRA